MRLLHQSPLASGYPLQCHGLVIVILSRIMLAPYHIRVPKTVPLLELFSSKGGTFQFQRRNSLVPVEELFSSKGGTLRFQRWKEKFPALENFFSSVGKLLFLRWKFNFPRLECFWKVDKTVGSSRLSRVRWHDK